MQRAYQEYNDGARGSGRTRGHFMVDLSRPGHLTACLRSFQERVAAGDDNWDAAFGGWAGGRAGGRGWSRGGGCVEQGSGGRAGFLAGWGRRECARLPAPLPDAPARPPPQPITCPHPPPPPTATITATITALRSRALAH